MRLIPPPIPYRAAAAQTDTSRDRVIDTLRAASLTVVVLGHVTMALVGWRGDVPTLGNVLASSTRLQVLTWLLQVMPLFFFAGGAANAISWRRKREAGYGTWLWGRAARLLRPLWVYLLVAAPAALLFGMVVPASTSAPLLLLTTQLLWFLGAYLAVTALTPVLDSVQRRRPVLTLAALSAAAAAVDVCRFALHLPAAFGLVNFIVVWTFAAQLGVAYVDAKLQGRAAAIVAVAGLGANAVAVSFGPYPVSMVGMPGEAVSNMAPPTLALAFHALWICAAAAAASRIIARAASRTVVWRYVVAVNLSAMTVYLWHLPVLILLSTLEHATGRVAPLRDDGAVLVPAGGYWPWFAVHASMFLLGVIVAVRLLWVLENTRLPVWDTPTRLPTLRTTTSYVAAGGGVVLCGVALLMFAATGLAGFPGRVVQYAGLALSSGLALCVLVTGAALVRLAGAPRRH